MLTKVSPYETHVNTKKELSHIAFEELLQQELKQ
jgi:hypothetical protein